MTTGGKSAKIKNILWLLTAVFVGLPLVLLLLVSAFNWTYILAAKVLYEPPGADIVVPEPPLPEDHAADELLRIAALVDKQRVDLSKPFPQSLQERLATCRALIESERAALLALDAWLAPPKPYGLARPADLGRHSRFPLPKTFEEPLPDLVSLARLGRVVVCRALVQFAVGHHEEGRGDLATLLLMADFLQQNPQSDASDIVGNRLYRMGLQMMKRHLPGEVLEQTLLPDPDKLLESRRMAAGGEWRLQSTFIHNPTKWDDLGLPGRLALAFGLLSDEYLMRLRALNHRGMLAHLVKGRLGVPIQPGEQANWEEMGPIKWIHQPASRILADMYSETPGEPFRPGWDTGQTMDMVEAVRIVLAARHYQRDQGQWPRQEQDLVPRYLASWPASALNGEPLNWLADRSGVEVMSQDGRTPCDPSEPCQFPFAPSEPISATTGKGQARLTKRSATP